MTVRIIFMMRLKWSDGGADGVVVEMRWWWWGWSIMTIKAGIEVLTSLVVCHHHCPHQNRQHQSNPDWLFVCCSVGRQSSDWGRGEFAVVLVQAGHQLGVRTNAPGQSHGLHPGPPASAGATGGPLCGKRHQRPLQPNCSGWSAVCLCKMKSVFPSTRLFKRSLLFGFVNDTDVLFNQIVQAGLLFGCVKWHIYSGVFTALMMLQNRINSKRLSRIYCPRTYNFDAIFKKKINRSDSCCQEMDTGTTH